MDQCDVIFGVVVTAVLHVGTLHAIGSVFLIDCFVQAFYAQYEELVALVVVYEGYLSDLEVLCQVECGGCAG